ncbi:hypothetical protein TrLO_g6916 [Triparma laevis f. longispina]|uniref:Uncharacterized protein n=1 Tax=Triparma laevis f. longispina TaxID=1714387 RepID=A0A9W7C4D6_9STRA|nr:hypothetical protein TrLO_g6916 [Triparma laevis f. longispina]
MATMKSKKLVPGEVTTVTPPERVKKESDAISALFTLSNSPVTAVAEPQMVPSPLASLISSKGAATPPVLDIDATPVTLPPRPPPSFRMAYAEACARENLTPDAHPGSRVSFSHPSFPKPWRVEQGNKKLFISHPSHKGEFNGYKKAMACQIELSRKGQQESWNGYTYCRGYPSISGSPGHVKWEYIGCKGTNDELCATCKVMEGKGSKKRKRKLPPPTSPKIYNTTLQAWGLHLSLHLSTSLTIYPKTHLNIPSSGTQVVCGQPLSVKILPGQVLFFSAGLIQAMEGRSLTPDDDLSAHLKISEKSNCDSCRGTEPESGPTKLCEDCWKELGSYRLCGTVESKSRKTRTTGQHYRAQAKRGDRSVKPCTCCVKTPKTLSVVSTPGVSCLSGDMETEGYELWSYSCSTTLQDIKDLPSLSKGRNHKWSPIFSESDSPETRYSIPRDRLGPTLNRLTTSLESCVSKKWGKGFRVGDVKVVHTEVGSEGQEPHREWQREVIIEGG